MNYKGVIFDLDGTLVDSIEDLGDAVNKVLLDHHFPPHSYTTYKRLIGNGLKKLVYDTLPENNRSNEMQAECRHQLFEVYEKNCMNKTKPYDGIFDLLSSLESKGIRCAVLSNKADGFTKQIVRTLFPKVNFEYIIGVTNEAEKKPHPGAALRICEGMGLEPADMIFIGDSGVDMQTANNAQMCAVGALWGFKSRKEIQQNGAAHLISHPLELTHIIQTNSDDRF